MHAGVVAVTDFDTKVAVVVRADLAAWQRLNVCAFLISGVAAACARRTVMPTLSYAGSPVTPSGGVVHCHSRLVAISAPSAMARNFAQTTVGTTTFMPAMVPKPQSVPAITLSRPTTSAY